MGYDVHRLTEGRKLILGGVEIPWEKGLLGHSDADVLLHAIMDALLGAAALRDIGRHFPDTDPAYEGADSRVLLRKVGEMLRERMYVINNIDATVIAQKPRLLPHIDRMVRNVAMDLELEEDQVNIKATTEEGLGFTGSLEGISAQAICSLSSALDFMPGLAADVPGESDRKAWDRCGRCAFRQAIFAETFSGTDTGEAAAYLFSVSSRFPFFYDILSAYILLFL